LPPLLLDGDGFGRGHGSKGMTIRLLSGGGEGWAIPQKV